jgi:hypothetical protein
MGRLRGVGAWAFFGHVALTLVAGIGTCAAEPVFAPSRAAIASTPSAPPQREAPRSREAGSQAVLAPKTQVPAIVAGKSRCGGFQDPRLLARHPAAQAGLKPSADAELLTELTKPAYLHVRLLATPTNHRAPPA